MDYFVLAWELQGDDIVLGGVTSSKDDPIFFGGQIRGV